MTPELEALTSYCCCAMRLFQILRVWADGNLFHVMKLSDLHFVYAEAIHGELSAVQTLHGELSAVQTRDCKQSLYTAWVTCVATCDATKFAEAILEKWSKKCSKSRDNWLWSVTLTGNSGHHIYISTRMNCKTHGFLANPANRTVETSSKTHGLLRAPSPCFRRPGILNWTFCHWNPEFVG